MPSGAKKRKAAKKKKENQPTNPSSSTHTYGGDDLKHQDDKESDVGEVSSPASQDHHSQHNILTEGEEDEIQKGEKDLSLPSVEGTNTEVGVEHNIVVEGDAISVEREFQIEDKSNEINGRIEHDEMSRKSYDGGSSGSSSSSSSSSSDDESNGIKGSESAVDIVPVADTVKVADTFSEEHVEAIESTHINVASSSISEIVSPVVSETISEKADVYLSSLANNSAAPYVVESVFNGNGEKNQGSIEEESSVPEASKEAASQKDEAIISSVETIIQENDDHLNLSCNPTTAAIDNGGDAEKESGVAEPLLVPVPHPQQTTSWKSCCGLFDLFSGSNR